jgi:hypothetical protein
MALILDHAQHFEAFGQLAQGAAMAPAARLQRGVEHLAVALADVVGLAQSARAADPLAVGHGAQLGER